MKRKIYLDLKKKQKSNLLLEKKLIIKMKIIMKKK